MIGVDGYEQQTYNVKDPMTTLRDTKKVDNITCFGGTTLSPPSLRNLKGHQSLKTLTAL